MDPEEFTRLYPIDTLTENEKANLTIEIQKMFALDYIIRNTGINHKIYLFTLFV